MKNYQKLLTAVSISLFTALPVQALDVPTPFAAGDPLTATRMEELRGAINDNDARAIANEGDVITNSANIASLFGGDGSAGPLVISANTNWASTPPTNFNFNFTTCTIEAGFTLTVPPGTTIRCSGDFINNGTINVLADIKGASPNSWGSGSSAEIYGIGHPGDTFKAASGGSYDNDSVTDPTFVYQGVGGDAIPIATAAASFKNFRFGGGSGGGFGGSGHGGGLIKVYSRGNITNTSNIVASGEGHCCQGGGGGGGIVILAAVNSITNTGAVSANGGSGADSRSFGGPGGGGGGGIVIFISPTIDNTGGTVDVVGGLAGTNTTNASGTTRLGGGGGGASGGNGGDGGSVSSAATGIPNAAQDGSDGYLLEITANPAFM